MPRTADEIERAGDHKRIGVGDSECLRCRGSRCGPPPGDAAPDPGQALGREGAGIVDLVKMNRGSSRASARRTAVTRFPRIAPKTIVGLRNPRSASDVANASAPAGCAPRRGGPGRRRLAIRPGARRPGHRAVARPRRIATSSSSIPQRSTSASMVARATAHSAPGGGRAARSGAAANGGRAARRRRRCRSSRSSGVGRGRHAWLGPARRGPTPSAAHRSRSVAGRGRSRPSPRCRGSLDDRCLLAADRRQGGAEKALVIALDVVDRRDPRSRTFVASRRPPIPTSTIARSSPRRASSTMAAAVRASNSVGGPTSAATRSIAGRTRSTAAAKSARRAARRPVAIRSR